MTTVATMDALAARQMKKRKEAEAKQLAQKKYEEKPYSERMPQEERDRLNKLLGYPEPPNQVFALARDAGAAVWWENPDQPDITKWEIRRYRKDRTKPDGGWYDKGYVIYENMERTQVLITDLTNDYEYRFTVRGYNAKGKSNESQPSNAVFCESPLPPGWFRFLDPGTRKYFYANVKTSQSSWQRPDLDPNLLDESIVLNFEPKEIKYLRGLFDEDMAHFGHVPLEQMMDIMREIGESVSKRWIRNLMRGYGGDPEKVTSWITFMEIINHIKNYRIKTAKLLANPTGSFFNFFAKFKAKALLNAGKKVKLGDWVLTHSVLADRMYYKNTVTGASAWTAPDEVKFYIPPSLEQKLLNTFNYGQIEEFRQFFTVLDVDGSGDLSPNEIKLLLNALDIQVDEGQFNRLIYSLDTNGNGTIEFDEFCFMMLEIYKKEKTGLFKSMNSNNNSSMDIIRSNSQESLASNDSGGNIGLERSDNFVDYSQKRKTLSNTLSNLGKISETQSNSSSAGGESKISLGGIGNAVSIIAGKYTHGRRMRMSGGGRRGSLTNSFSFKDFSFSTSFKSDNNNNNNRKMSSDGRGKQLKGGCRFLCCICSRNKPQNAPDGGTATATDSLLKNNNANGTNHNNDNVNSNNNCNDDISVLSGDQFEGGVGGGGGGSIALNSTPGNTMFAVAMSRKSNKAMTAADALLEFSRGDPSSRGASPANGNTPNKKNKGWISSGSSKNSPVKVAPINDDEDCSTGSMGSYAASVDNSSYNGSNYNDMSGSGTATSGNGRSSSSSPERVHRRKPKEEKHGQYCMCGCRRY